FLDRIWAGALRMPAGKELARQGQEPLAPQHQRGPDIHRARRRGRPPLLLVDGPTPLPLPLPLLRRRFAPLLLGRALGALHAPNVLHLPPALAPLPAAFLVLRRVEHQ